MFNGYNKLTTWERRVRVPTNENLVIVFFYILLTFIIFFLSYSYKAITFTSHTYEVIQELLEWNIVQSKMVKYILCKFCGHHMSVIQNNGILKMLWDFIVFKFLNFLLIQ